MTTIEAPKTTPKEVTTADVLERAADLLEEFGFCQKDPAQDERGLAVHTSDPSVARFCMWGALVRAEDDFGFGDEAEHVGEAAIMALVGPGWITWGLEPGRTKSEVVALLREAAERSRETA